MNNKKLIKLYYDTRTAYQIIGCLLKKPSLLRDNKYDLSPDDFYIDFHQYIFSAINNLYENGVEIINFIEIEGYLHNNSPKGYKIVFEDNDGMDWLAECMEHSAIVNFDYNYNRIKKFSLLRDALIEGEEVSDILDLEEVDNKQIEKQGKIFDDMSLKELIQHFDKRILKLKTKYSTSRNNSNKKAGDNSENILQHLIDGESYGLLTRNGYNNEITFGCRRTKFVIKGGSTGSGKSRTLLDEMAQLTAVELWDYNSNQFIKNPNNPNGILSSIYIGVELNLDYEVEVILWGVISGVETSHIKKQTYEDGEEERVKYAIDILKRSKIYLYDEPNYDIATIRSICDRHTMNKDEDLYMVAIDYILLTGNLVIEAREYSKGVYTREDQIFLYISDMFKRVANDYNVYLASRVQLNRGKDDPKMERNEAIIRASYSLSDKLDVGSILLPPNKMELDKAEEIIKQVMKWKPIIPNMVEHFYKVRDGELREVRVWKYVNMGNMKSEDLFITGYDYKLIENITKILPEYVNESEAK